jgi:hypothetical protein
LILDATAGNRTMWSIKHSDHIIYIDKTLALEVAPTLFCDNECTPFKDATFDTIFYDPPHTWGNKTDFHAFPRRTEEYIKKWKDKSIPRYYGWDIYDSRSQLVKHIYNAQKEFARIGKEDCLLWLKWNEMSIVLSNVLSVMSDWEVLMDLYISAPLQTRGEHQTYWLCMQKKKGVSQTLLFDAVPASYDSSVARFDPTKPKQSIA